MPRGPCERIVMCNWLTTDGYFTGPDGTLDWVVPEDEQAKAAARDIASFDTVLSGVTDEYEAVRDLGPAQLVSACRRN